jgi:hypothetical protein
MRHVRLPTAPSPSPPAIATQRHCVTDANAAAGADHSPGSRLVSFTVAYRKNCGLFRRTQPYFGTRRKTTRFLTLESSPTYPSVFWERRPSGGRRSNRPSAPGINPTISGTKSIADQAELGSSTSALPADIRLFNVEKAQHWNGRGHFFGVAAARPDSRCGHKGKPAPKAIGFVAAKAIGSSQPSLCCRLDHESTGQ